jgi:hypothetical protein
LCFVVIVYFLPGGIAPLIERYLHTLAHPRPGGPSLMHLALRFRAGAARFVGQRRL